MKVIPDSQYNNFGKKWEGTHTLYPLDLPLNLLYILYMYVQLCACDCMYLGKPTLWLPELGVTSYFVTKLHNTYITFKVSNTYN